MFHHALPVFDVFLYPTFISRTLYKLDHCLEESRYPGPGVDHVSSYQAIGLFRICQYARRPGLLARPATSFRIFLANWMGEQSRDDERFVEEKLHQGRGGEVSVVTLVMVDMWRHIMFPWPGSGHDAVICFWLFQHLTGEWTWHRPFTHLGYLYLVQTSYWSMSAILLLTTA